MKIGKLHRRQTHQFRAIRGLTENAAYNGLAFGNGRPIGNFFGIDPQWHDAALHKATVMRENRDGTFDLKYDDGDKERSVKRNLIRPLNAKKGIG